MNKVVHFEIPADDLDRAKAFYGTVFGWRLWTMQMPGGGDYTSALTAPVDEQTQQPSEPGAINGALTPRANDTPAPVITIDVEAIDDALAAVGANGGRTVIPRTEIPGMGAYAYFTDCEGNVMGLWETVSSGGSGSGSEGLRPGVRAGRASGGPRRSARGPAPTTAAA